MTTIPVYYTPNMVTDSLSFSPSARKPQHVVARWSEKNLPIDIRVPTPLTVEQLCIAHSKDYVTGVLEGRIPNGFENCDLTVAQTLPYTNGAMYAAAMAAVQSQKVACAPVSGFHHAKYAKADGFCTFNGLVITAMLLRQQLVRAAIFDFDAHYGDGTDLLLDHHNIANIPHWTFGAYAHDRPSALKTLPDIVETIEDFHARGAELLLYQAGADPHIKDPYGGFLTDAELRERDRLVFTTAARLKLPVAWCLAGGYQQLYPDRQDAESIAPVLDVHEATMRECVAAYAS